MSLSLSVLSQSGPPKSVGGGGVVVGGVVYHTSTGQYIGVATFFFFFFFFASGLKLDENSIENGLEGQKFLVVCLFWGGSHHPNGLSIKTFASPLIHWHDWVVFLRMTIDCLGFVYIVSGPKLFLPLTPWTERAKGDNLTVMGFPENANLPRKFCRPRISDIYSHKIIVFVWNFWRHNSWGK